MSVHGVTKKSNGMFVDVRVFGEFIYTLMWHSNKSSFRANKRNKTTFLTK